MLYVAGDSEVRDVQYVSSICRKVKDFISDSRRDRQLGVMESTELAELCVRLQRFLTYTPGQKAMQHADDPTSLDQVTRRQGIMYDMGLVDMLVSICCDLESFHPELSHKHIISDPEEGHVRYLCANCFKVMTLLVRKNHIIGMHLSDNILGLVEPLDNLASAYTHDSDNAIAHHYLQDLLQLIIEIYHDSPAALSNLQSVEIKMFVQLFRCSENPRWQGLLFRILGMLCIYRVRPSSATESDKSSASSLLQSAQMDGTANSRRSGDYLSIPSNQAQILGDMMNTDVINMCPETKVSEADHDVMLIHFKQASGMAEWQPIENALALPHYQHHYDNFLFFLKSLLHGRSAITDEIMKKVCGMRMLDFDGLSHILLSTDCPSRTRAIAALSLINAFVDNLPQQDCCSVLRFQDWNQLSTPIANSSDKSPANSHRFAAIQAFLLQHLEANDVSGMNFDDDCLLQDSLMLMYFLVRYGFFNQTLKEALDRAAAAQSDPRTSSSGKASFAYLESRIRAMWVSENVNMSLDEWASEMLMVKLLLQPLWLLLDTKTDVDVTSEQASARLNALQGNSPLFSTIDHAQIEHKHVVVGTKKWACRILDLVSNVRLNVRIKIALAVFDADLSAGKKLGDAPRLDDPTSHKVQRAEFERIFQVLESDIHKSSPICLQLLTSPAMQADAEASHSVLQLVLRLFGQRHEVMRTLNDIQLIVDPQLMFSYKDVSIVYQQMQLLNVRLAACEHKLIEAMHLHEKMKTEEMNENLVSAFAVSSDLPSSGSYSDHASQGSIPITHELSHVQSFIGGLSSGITKLGSGLGIDTGFTGEQEPTVSSGVGEFRPVTSVGELMQGKGGMFDNLLGAQSNVFDGLNKYMSSKTLKTPRGNVSSASLRPTSIQEHRQVIQMRRLASSKSHQGSIGGSKSSTPLKKKKGVTSDIMNDIESEAEQRMRNASLLGKGKALEFDSSVVQELRTVVSRLVGSIDELLQVVLGSKVGSHKIQHMFRTLNIHIAILETISLLMSGDQVRMPSDPSLNLLLYNSFSFLASFASGMPPNQEILFQYLEHLIIPQLLNSNAVFVAAADAFIAVFHNHRVLSSRFDDKMCATLIGCIKGNGQKAAYLRCLGAVLCPKDIPIKRNQQRVLAHLEAEITEGIDGEKLMPLYIGRNGLQKLRLLMEEAQLSAQSAADQKPPRPIRRSSRSSGDSNSQTARAGPDAGQDPAQQSEIPFTPRRQIALDQQTCPVLFYEETLNLLSKCGMMSDTDIQRKCRRIIPASHLAELITAPWCEPRVKIAALHFLKECHFDVPDHNARKSACMDRSSWRVLGYLREVIVNVVARLPETFCDHALYGPLAKHLEEELVVKSLRVITVFVHACYRAKLARKEDTEELSLLVDILIRMMSEGGLTPTVNTTLNAALVEFDKRDIASGSTVKQFLKTLLRSSFMDNMNTRGEVDSVEDRNPRSELPAFLSDLENRLDTTSESKALCVTFESNPGAVQVISANLYKSNESNRREYVEVLEYIWRSLTKHRPLEEIIETMRIDHLIEVVVKLIAQGTDSSVESALRLGISLLECGQAPIQEVFLAAMKKPNAHGMLEQLFSRLEMAREEMCELRIIVFQVGNLPLPFSPHSPTASREYPASRHPTPTHPIAPHFLHPSSLLSTEQQWDPSHKGRGGCMHTCSLGLQADVAGPAACAGGSHVRWRYA
jgi:hypothetical protein